VVLPLETDYLGYVAWGEYPHNFAAVLNQVAIGIISFLVWYKFSGSNGNWR
jgi:hypothetical protein